MPLVLSPIEVVFCKSVLLGSLFQFSGQPSSSRHRLPFAAITLQRHARCLSLRPRRLANPWPRPARFALRGLGGTGAASSTLSRPRTASLSADEVKVVAAARRAEIVVEVRAPKPPPRRRVAVASPCALGYRSRARPRRTRSRAIHDDPWRRLPARACCGACWRLMTAWTCPR